MKRAQKQVAASSVVDRSSTRDGKDLNRLGTVPTH